MGAANRDRRRYQGTEEHADLAAAIVDDGLQAFCIPVLLASIEYRIGLGRHGQSGQMLLEEADCGCFFLTGHGLRGVTAEVRSTSRHR